MLSERLKKALMIAGSITIAVCFVCILLLSRALSLEKDKQQKIDQEQAAPIALPAATLDLLPGSGNPPKSLRLPLRSSAVPQIKPAAGKR